MSTMGSVSGLLVNSDYMTVISHNIANASTVGYKASKPIFFDMCSRSFYSNNACGYGVGISNIMQNFNNGMLMETGRELDLGIVQDGFFRVVDAQGNIYYTRDGQFLLDQDQNIINMQGMYVTGQNQSYPNKKFNHITNIEPINLKRAHILKEKPTSEITLKAVLNSNTETNESGEYKTYINIYNTDGQIEKINISFNKKDKNKWTVNVQSDDDKNKSINNTFELNFDSHGKLIKNSRFVIESKDSKYENITLNLTDSIEQSDIDNSWEEYFQNGYARGSLKTFNILPNGEIVGTYSNQKEQTIGQILLSKFTSPEKLQPESGNLWSATTASGKEKIGIAGNNGFGVLSKQTLEASNVDLNKELINMIIAQRNYQSNAQSFKTEDKIISTLINLR